MQRVPVSSATQCNLPIAYGKQKKGNGKLNHWNESDQVNRTLSRLIHEATKFYRQFQEFSFKPFRQQEEEEKDPPVFQQMVTSDKDILSQ